MGTNQRAGFNFICVNLWVLVLLLLWFPAQAWGETIDDYCEAKYYNYPGLIATCERDNEQAKILTDMQKTNIDSKIMDHCVDKWEPAWTMVRYCINRETVAKKWFDDKKFFGDRSLFDSCVDKWGEPNWSMIKYCIRRNQKKK